MRLVNSNNNTTHGREPRLENDHNQKTINFIKQVLCSSSVQTPGPNGKSDTSFNDEKGLEELLPPLTSSNAVDVQLYAIIAVILRQFVQAWYNRITPDDHFVDEIVQIIAHCTRGLESRLRRVDLEDLLLDELPALAVAHLDGGFRVYPSSFFVNAKQLSRSLGGRP